MTALVVFGFELVYFEPMLFLLTYTAIEGRFSEYRYTVSDRRKGELPINVEVKLFFHFMKYCRHHVEASTYINKNYNHGFCKDIEAILIFLISAHKYNSKK